MLRCWSCAGSGMADRLYGTGPMKPWKYKPEKSANKDSQDMLKTLMLRSKAGTSSHYRMNVVTEPLTSVLTSKPAIVPEKSTGGGVHDWPGAILHGQLVALALRLHGQCLRDGLQQLTVALGATVTPLPPLTGFTLMLQPGVVQPHSLLQQPLEVPEFPGAHTVESGVAEL